MSFKDIIKTSVLNNLASDITIKRIVVVLAISMILGLYVFLIYRVAVNNEFYSKDFNRTLVLMSVTTAAIVLALQSNLVISLGMVGALSIVRYRTAIKSPIDLFFMFWSISIGIICGAGLYILAAALCVVLTVGFFLTEKMASPKSPGLLVINCDSLDAAEHVTDLVRPLTKLLRTKNKMVYKDNVELILEYKTDDEKALEAALSADDAVKNYSMMCYDSATRT